MKSRIITTNMIQNKIVIAFKIIWNVSQLKIIETKITLPEWVGRKVFYSRPVIRLRHQGIKETEVS